MKRLVMLIASLASLVVIAAPVVPGVTAVNAPRIPVKQGTSLNWSGYDVPASASPVTYVSGTWQVPTVTATSTNAYSSIWVGIDGDGSNTVEQIGTEQDWVVGRGAVYSVWYEMYPKFPVTISMPISPGDTFTASVRAQPKNTFVLTITNVTRNQTFTTTQKCPSARLASAEWIVEAPWSGGVLPLANFGTVKFSGCTATIGGITGDIANFSYDAIDMVNSSGALKDHTSKLSGGGTSFSVTYLSSN